MRKQLEVSLVETEAEFQALASAWNLLWEQTTNRTVFQTFEWTDAAWQWAKSNSSLWIFILHEQGNKNALVGILPLIRRIEKYRGIPVRITELLSVPDNQLCDALLNSAHIKPGVTAFAQALAERKHDWDVLRLNLLSEESPLLTYLPSVLTNIKYRPQIHQEENNPEISLEGTWQHYYNSRSRRLKKGNNLIANRLNKTYNDIHIEWLWGNNVSREEFDKALAQVVQISENSWKETTGRTLGQSGPKDFIQRLTYHAQRKGWISIGLLHLNGIAVASEYQIIHNGQVYALRADYLEAYSQDSPGTYLQWKLIEKLFGNELKYYRMGPGGNTYKLRWAEDITPLHQLTVCSNTMKGKLIQHVDLTLVPFVKTLCNLWRRIIGSQT